MAVTSYTEVMRKVREVTFDRFVTPAFFIKSVQADATWSVQITSTEMIVKKTGTGPVTHTLPFATYPTIGELVDAFTQLSAPVEIVYSGSFIPTEPASSLSIRAEKSIELYIPIFRKYYFSDTIIESYFNQFAAQMLGLYPDKIDSLVWADELSSSSFDRAEQEHFILWVSYHVVGLRRLYELAGQQLQMSTYSGVPGLGAGVSSLNASNFSMTLGAGERLEVNVGDVFSLSEEPGSSIGLYNNGEIPKDMVPPWGVGSDNVLMDYYSFWYRLQLWIRDRFEYIFNDTSLRRNTIMTGKMSLDYRDSTKWYGYFDSYPWVFNPQLRGVPGTNGISSNLGRW